MTNKLEMKNSDVDDLLSFLENSETANDQYVKVQSLRQLIFDNYEAIAEIVEKKQFTRNGLYNLIKEWLEKKHKYTGPMSQNTFFSYWYLARKNYEKRKETETRKSRKADKQSQTKTRD